jgi:hypothetical protein
VRALALAILLAACDAEPLPTPPLPPPVVTCPAALPVPAALPRVVSLDQLAAAYHAVDVARQAERTRGDLCADSAHRLDSWINEDSQ